MYRVRLVLRGLWWRRGLTAAVVIVAAITTMSAALGPMYARAAGESTLRDQLTSAPVTATGLHYQASTDVTSTFDFQAVLDQAPHPGKIPGYPTRIPGIFLPTGATGLGGAVTTALLWRQGICSHVVITSGTCPTKAGQLLVSARTVASKVYGWKLGQPIALDGLSVDGVDAKGFPVAAPASGLIVGTYRPVNTADAYWFGQDYFDAHAGRKTDAVDSVIVAPAEFHALTAPTNAEVDVDLPLAEHAVRWSAVPALQRGVGHLATLYAQGGDNFHTSVNSVIKAARHQRALVYTGTTLVTLQLGLLAWLVLFQVVSDTAEARGNEIALAKVRGRGPLSTLRFGLSEPLVLLLLAIPLGLVLALGVVHVFAATVLAAGTPVVLPGSAVLAAFVAFAGGVLAAVLAAQRTLTRSALEQWQRTTSQVGQSRLALVVDVLSAAAAIAALVVLRRHHHSGTGNDSAALLAPGLLVAAIALLGVRLLPPFCRALVPMTRASRRVGLFLALRQVSRRPTGLRLAALLAIALGLATFAVAGETVALANRDARAKAELGAAQVASVQYSAADDPVTAVAKADPAGRWAMATATWLPDGGDSVVGRVLAVDSRRLAAVGLPAAGGPGVAAIEREIVAAPVPAITVTAPKMRVRIIATGLSRGPTPNVELDFRAPRKPFLAVPVGPLRTGTHYYVGTLPCALGCSLVGITWNRPVTADSAQTGTVLVTGLAVGNGRTWSPVNARVTQSDAWRASVPIGTARDAVQATPAGVRDRYENDNGGYGGITYASSASPIPVVATRPAVVSGSDAPSVLAMTDVTQTSATFVVRQYARVLPGVLDDGLMMDVNYLSQQLPAFAGEATWSVWIGRHAPSDAVSRLRAAGLIVQSVKTERSRVIVLGRQGPALALLLLLGCAVAGTVLAVGGTAISVSASSRRRSYELAALRTIGISRRTLLRAGVYEQLLLLGTAVVLGVPGGLLAARLAIPAIPEFSDATPVSLRYTPSALPVVVFVAGFAMLLTVTAIVAAIALVRVAVPGRLREDEE